MKKRAIFVLGTRPEAIKLAPVIRYAREHADDLDVVVCSTGQHREMLDQVLGLFGVQPDFDLAVMKPGQTLFGSTAAILSALEGVFARCSPDIVVVQGDTTTTLCGALAGLYRQVPVAHVEAGLRTGDFRRPFPEEANRVLVGRIAALHLAATNRAADNLRAEGVAEERLHVTGNSGIDAVMWVRSRLRCGEASSGLELPDFGARRLITVTSHRRENHGAGLDQICGAISGLAASRDDIEFVFPVHPNPSVRGHVERALGRTPRVHLVQPLDYLAFVDLMCRSHLILTDSGGIQEEAPSLGKPVLVMREKTERPEAVEAGATKLVGSDAPRIMREVGRLLDDEHAYAAMAGVRNPYGDGNASGRILRAMLKFLRPDRDSFPAGTPDEAEAALCAQ